MGHVPPSRAHLPRALPDEAAVRSADMAIPHQIAIFLNAVNDAVAAREDMLENIPPGADLLWALPAERPVLLPCVAIPHQVAAGGGPNGSGSMTAARLSGEYRRLAQMRSRFSWRHSINKPGAAVEYSRKHIPSGADLFRPLPIESPIQPAVMPEPSEIAAGGGPNGSGSCPTPAWVVAMALGTNSTSTRGVSAYTMPLLATFSGEGMTSRIP